jgi:DNA-binding beta-propeller fold protein YncE
MSEESASYSRLTFALCASLAFAAGCDPDDDTQDEPPGVFATRPSRSSTIAVSEDGARVAMVNPEDGTLSIFQTTDNARTAKVATGGNPSAVVLSADGKTAFVANRADGTVVRVTGIDGPSPAIDGRIDVGAEPIGLALSPSGKQLFVAEFAESRVSVIDTAKLEIATSVKLDRPRALLITNNGDTEESDETLAVTQFYGTPVAGREGKDDGRLGKVRLYTLTDLAQYRDVSLGALDSGFPKKGDPALGNVTTSANQLASVATSQGRIYITSIAASPQDTARFDNNVFPVVYVAELASATEVRGGGGTTNLARKIQDAIPNPSAAAPRFIPGDLSAIEFVGASNVAYAIGRAGDVMQRVVFGDTVEIGSTQNKQIDLAGNDQLGRCQAPTGVAIDPVTNKAYVSCWITRRMAVVDLGAQALVQTVEASPAPAGGVEQSIQRGRRFYFTGRGRWSAAGGNGAKGGEGWSACSSCHPDGLSDNITWTFASGPRQTTSQDGTFSHGPGAQKQRMLNWTAIFDRHHDFERNTRDVSGGLGAITKAATPAECNQLDKEIAIPLTLDLLPTGGPIAGLGRPLKELADDPTIANCGHKDWDDIEAFVKVIQPVKALRAVDPASVDRGRQLFVEGACAKCHGGAGWTVSRLHFTPTSATNGLLAGTAFQRPAFFPVTWMYDVDLDDTTNAPVGRKLLSRQPRNILADETGPAELAAVAVQQDACVLRNVGTFGVPGDTLATDDVEKRALANGNLVRSEGRGGYNVPSLYGLALGAPYLHHGQAATLGDLFTDSRWKFHTNAGNANFSVRLGEPGKLDDLTAYLLSIDATTAEIAVPVDPNSGASFDVCQ